MYKLHKYQTKLVNQARQKLSSGKKSVLIVSPAGSGKSVVIAEIARLALIKPHGQVMFMVHRKELVEQITQSFKANEVDLSRCTIMTVGKIAHRLDKLPKPTLIICDESHHSLAKTYKKIYEYYSEVPRLGFTASPWRLSGKGLGDVYESMVEGPDVKWLIDNHYLAPYKYKSVTLIDSKKLKKSSSGDYTSKSIEDSIGNTIFGDVVENYRKFSDGKQAIVYAHSVEYSQQAAEQFKLAGISAAHVDSKTSESKREQIMNSFKKGEITIICNVDLIGEGFNVPDCGTVILMRPTKSLVVDIQQSMRGMRYRPGKVSTIIDMVGNYTRFGLPDQPREWSLEDWKEQNKVRISTCDFCYATFNTSDWVDAVDEEGRKRRKCPECGELAVLEEKNPSRSKELDKSAELVDVNSNTIQALKLMNFASRNPYKSKSISNIYKILKSQKELGTREIKYPLQRTLHIRMDQLHGKIPMKELEKLSDVSKVPMNSIQISYRTAFRKHNFKNERDGITLRF